MAYRGTHKSAAGTPLTTQKKEVFMGLFDEMTYQKSIIKLFRPPPCFENFNGVLAV